MWLRCVMFLVQMSIAKSRNTLVHSKTYSIAEELTNIIAA